MNIVVEILGVEIPALVVVYFWAIVFLGALALGIHFDNKKEGN
jgi:hypothetical protein